MIIKVYLNRIKRDISPALNKARAYFAKHGVSVDFSTESSDFRGYQLETNQYPFVGLEYVVGDINVTPTQPTIVVLDGAEFDRNKTPVPTTQVKNGFPLIKIMSYSDGLYNLEHEIMHALGFIVKGNGYPYDDPMDVFFRNGIAMVYYKNNNLDAPDGNFSEAWTRLTPYLFLFNPMQLVAKIKRIINSDKETIGDLVATSGYATFTCKTIELPWKQNQHNISCIPVGTYQVKYSFSPGLLKSTYEVLNVPNRSGIRIHVANYFSDLKGCIGLGNGVSDINGDGQPDVINSRITIAAFEGFFGKNPFTLIIE